MLPQTITLLTVLSLQALTAYAAPGAATTKAPVIADACAKFTSGECYKGTSSDEFPFETYNPEKSSDGSECRMFCETFYKSFCKFYIYDRRLNQCQFWNVDKDKYLSTCNLQGGPKSKTQDDCQTNDCVKFTNEECIYEGSVLETFRFISTPDICQEICNYSENCKYYVHDKKGEECKTFDSDKFNCDMVKADTGAADADYKKCNANDDNPPKPSTIPTTTKKPWRISSILTLNVEKIYTLRTYQMKQQIIHSCLYLAL